MSSVPLSMRSAVLSLVLGAHPTPIAPGRMVAAGSTLGMPESGVRVALTRAVASGDLRREESGYALGERLLGRQSRQAEGVAPHPRPWDGTWETAIVVVSGRTASERASLRTLLSEHRLAELREGVWMRPANLTRDASYEEHPDLLVCSTTHLAAEGLASRLWDLTAWSQVGTQLLEELERAAEPAVRLAVAAEVVRHLATDPILPDALVPPDWVGVRLREAYSAYQEEVRDLLLVDEATAGTR